MYNTKNHKFQTYTQFCSHKKMFIFYFFLNSDFVNAIPLDFMFYTMIYHRVMTHEYTNMQCNFLFFGTKNIAW